MANATSSEKSETIQDIGLTKLFLHGLQDICYAEKKLTKALQKMINAANSDDLVSALTRHLGETEGHVGKVEKIFELLGKPVEATKCEAIDGITAQGDSILEVFQESPASDAAIIFAAQAAEHYEITRYGSLRGFAEILDYDEAQAIIDGILEQEKDADEKLTEIAEDRVDRAAANKPAGKMRDGDDRTDNLWRLWS